MKENYKLTVGLEIHAELNTQTKMFCDSKNDHDETHPNINICPVCTGHPGTLPVINKEAVKSILRLGLAVNGELADYTEFDRKNYFYPDIPKGYQISQYKHPLVKGGELAGVKLIRIHLEEDTAKSIHQFTPTNLPLIKGEVPEAEGVGDESLIDFNRAGVPLMELVTEPVIHKSETAARFAKELQLLLNYLNISEANMEKGEFRIEANVSINMGTKVEIKNLNSFKSVERAISYEFERQKVEKVTQETRGWDENKGETFSQRLKEESHDYRYFPDPDLPKLFIKEIPDFAPEELRRAQPELPWQKRERLLKLGISQEHAEIYVTQVERGELFEETVRLLGNGVSKLTKLVSNYITTDLKKLIPAESLAEVVRMIDGGELSSRGAKEILKILQGKDGNARKIAEENNLMQESDKKVLNEWIEEVLKVEDRNAPKQFLVGQVMKKSGGRANPIILQKLFDKLL